MAPPSLWKPMNPRSAAQSASLTTAPLSVTSRCVPFAHGPFRTGIRQPGLYEEATLSAVDAFHRNPTHQDAHPFRRHLALDTRRPDLIPFLKVVEDASVDCFTACPAPFQMQGIIGV